MDQISVGRLTVHCVVPRDHPDPQSVRSRLDEIAAGPLTAALSELLAPLAKLGDEVVVLRRLELDFDLDLSGHPSELARRWAARLAAALAASLLPEARTTMLRFADEAGYLARYLIDRAAGCSARPWYYRRYRGFDALSAAAAMRAAILDVPARGLAALRVLEPHDLSRVLAAIGGPETRRIIETLTATGGDGDHQGIAAALTAAAGAWVPLAAATTSIWGAALALLALASAALRPEDLAPAARLALAASARRAARAGSDGAGPSPVESRPARSSDEAPAVDLTPLLAIALPGRTALVSAIEADAAPASAELPISTTRYGGLLMLLPHVVALLLDALWPDQPDLGCARLAVLARAAGAARAEAVFGDPVLRRILDVGADISLAGWLADQERPIADQLGAILAETPRRRARAIGLGVARWPGWGAVRVAIAEPDGDWIALGPLTAALRAEMRATAPPTLTAARAHGRVLAHVVPAHAPATGAEPSLAIAAQQVLRAFARRLPGFADSSPAFLYDNFLDFDATVVERNGCFQCRTGRPRLAALLGLTGTLRGRTQLRVGSVTVELQPAS